MTIALVRVIVKKLPEVSMKSIKCLLTIILLFFSTQSSALFMPAGFQLGAAEMIATDDGDC